MSKGHYDIRDLDVTFDDLTRLFQNFEQSDAQSESPGAQINLSHFVRAALFVPVSKVALTKFISSVKVHAELVFIQRIQAPDKW